MIVQCQVRPSLARELWRLLIRHRRRGVSPGDRTGADQVRTTTVLLPHDWPLRNHRFTLLKRLERPKKQGH
jgi:hypothetical protein